MSRPQVSVVIASFQRAHLLSRSLVCYQNQYYDSYRMEIVLIDDHSTDGTRDLVLDWSKTTGIRATVLTTAPKPQAWRDCGAILNNGIRAAAGEYIILSHGEVMPGRRSVAGCVEALQKFEAGRPAVYNDPQTISTGPECRELGLYACCPVFYLSPQDQDRIDTVPWQVHGAGAVRDIEGFYTDDTNGHPDYRHEVADKVGTPGFRIPTWESFVFSGHSRETWKRLGGLQETSRWGAVDCAWMMRRRVLGIPNHTCVGGDYVCVHQWHGGTERDEQGWRDELSGIDWNDKQSLVWPAVDELGW